MVHGQVGTLVQILHYFLKSVWLGEIILALLCTVHELEIFADVEFDAGVFRITKEQVALIDLLFEQPPTVIENMRWV